MYRTTRTLGVLSISCLTLAAFAATGREHVPDDTSTREVVQFFEQSVRPLLAARCFECHGPDREHPRSGLALVSREALLRGGHHGPAVVPGDPGASLLVQTVRREGELAMPPDDPLSAAEVAVLERWVELGAPWPGALAPAADRETAALEHWAWQPPVRPTPPDVQREAFVSNAIDRFVLARLEDAGLEPNPPATDRELVRRLYFDLLGLPPTFEEIEAYCDDTAPDKWERLVDTLLQRPEYGERQGRHWLDVVRFAQTNGYERDAEKPYAAGYRDYVIQSFQDDKPYDAFLREQLAGDEFDDATRDALVATGFYRLGTWDSEPDDRLQAEMDALDDVLGAIGGGMLGLTITCARCHDHLTDPIRQEEYYGLLALIRNVERWSKPQFTLGDGMLRAWSPSEIELLRHEQNRSRAIAELQLEREERIAHARVELLANELAGKPEAVRDAIARPASALNKEEGELVAAHFTTLPDDAAVIASLDDTARMRLFLIQQAIKDMAQSFEGELDWLLVVTERDEPEPTHLLTRGNARSPQDVVEPAFPAILCADEAEAQPRITPRRADAPHSGRRTALAEWITDPEHPTTARVIVNRLWQGHFGRGIVATPNDLGLTGALPTHPELLDWLAMELVDGGWSLKALHRTILASSTYRMSSRVRNTAAELADPDNSLLWRQELRRLDAEALRDTLLDVSGDLNLERGGRGFFPRLPREALAGASKPGEGWEHSPPDELRRRTVYTFVKRGMQPPLLEAFDLASPNLPVGTRAVTTTATQALALLNDAFVDERTRSLARGVLESVGDDTARVRELWRRVLAREPSSQELELALAHLEAQTAAAESIAPALVFDMPFPRRLQVDFLESLDDDAFLHVPGVAWNTLRGRWANEYNDTREVDLSVGPAALLDAPKFADGLVRMRVKLGAGSEVAGFLMRAEEVRGEAVALEFVLDPALREARWVHLTGPGVEPRVLARAPFDVPIERTFELQLELREGYGAARIDGKSVVSASELPHHGAGRFGVRTIGGALELQDLALRTADGEVAIAPAVVEPHVRAFESLCLVVLNLNEFVYVD